MTLKIAGIGEDFLTVLADVTSRFVMRYLMPDEIAFPVKDFGTLVALVLSFVSSFVGVMTGNNMVV